jgi:hypothetical protein
MADSPVLWDNFTGTNGQSIRTGASGRLSDSGHQWQGSDLTLSGGGTRVSSSNTGGTNPRCYMIGTGPGAKAYMQGQLIVPTTNATWRAGLGFCSSTGGVQASAELEYSRTTGDTSLLLRTGLSTFTTIAVVDSAGIDGSTGFGNPTNLPNPSFLRYEDGVITLNGVDYPVATGKVVAGQTFYMMVGPSGNTTNPPAWDFVEGGDQIEAGADITGQASGFTSGGFGTPELLIERIASGFNSTQFGTPIGGQSFKAQSMGRTTKFGTPYITQPRAFQATGFCTTKFGTPNALRMLPPRNPKDRHYHAAGFNSSRFGTPSLG